VQNAVRAVAGGEIDSVVMFTDVVLEVGTDGNISPVTPVEI